MRNQVACCIVMVVLLAHATNALCGTVGHAEGSSSELLEVMGTDAEHAPESIAAMPVSGSLSLIELRDLAKEAVPLPSGRVEPSEEYVVFRCAVRAAEMVYRPEAVPPLWPYAQYSVTVEEVVVAPNDIMSAAELDVVAMWPPRYRDGVAGGARSTFGNGDLQVPLSVGHSVIAVGVRDPEMKNSWFYRRELWPMLHVVFAVVEDGVGDWHAVVPESRREYSQTLAREAGASAPVRLEAWLGSTRRIVGAAEDIMDVLYEVTVEVVEQ